LISLLLPFVTGSIALPAWTRVRADPHRSRFSLHGTTRFPFLSRAAAMPETGQLRDQLRKALEHRNG
jgi:hypothetical protein